MKFRYVMFVCFISALMLCACNNSSPNENSGAFDPVAAVNIQKAFAAASSLIIAQYPRHELSFVQLKGVPQGSGATYLATPFKWMYTVAACDTSSGECGETKGVEIEWPGWTGHVVDAMPMGAYLPEDEFSTIVPLDLEQLLGVIADHGVTPSTCPITDAGGGILLYGTLSGGSSHWVWNIWCDNQIDNQYYFDTQGNQIY